MDWLLLFLGSCISYLSLQRECSMVLPRLGYSPRNARRPNPAPREIFFIQNTPLRDCMEGGGRGGFGAQDVWTILFTDVVVYGWLSGPIKHTKKTRECFWFPVLHTTISNNMVCWSAHVFIIRDFVGVFFFFNLIFFFLPVLWTTNSGIV